MPETAQQVYDRLWAEAMAAFEAGTVRTDPYLLQRETDTRQGITLIARPDPPTLVRIGELLEGLQRVAPEQYIYRPEELHITVLSLIGTSPEFCLEAAPIEQYKALFADQLPCVRPFTIRYPGIVASPDAVMLRGYSDALNVLRDHLRTELTRAGLGGTLDRRYRSVTAHSTVMRFQVLPFDLPALVRYLRTMHDHDFGVFDVDHLDFVVNDWFMSHDKTQVLARYVL